MPADDTRTGRTRRAKLARRGTLRKRSRALRELALLRDVARQAVNDRAAGKLAGARRADVSPGDRARLVFEIEAERADRLAAVNADYRRKVEQVRTAAG